MEQCKACGKPKPSLAVEQGDDFCSTECARRHYGSSPARPARGVILAGHASSRRAAWRRLSGVLNGRKP